jgi:hypothetical protein
MCIKYTRAVGDGNFEPLGIVCWQNALSILFYYIEI